MGHMQKSAVVMKHMNQMMKVPQISAVCQAMSKEMMKAGIIGEMVSDSFEMLDNDDIDELADQEVDKVLFEITEGQFGSISEIDDKLADRVCISVTCLSALVLCMCLSCFRSYFRTMSSSHVLNPCFFT